MKKMIVAVALLTSFCALAQTPTAQRPEVKVGELSTYRTVDLQDRKETLLVMTVTESQGGRRAVCLAQHRRQH
jgi:hypothetical protein